MNENNDRQQQVTAKLVKAIQEQRAVQTLKIERDAVIAGRTGDHQVDVYWEFTDGEITYKTIIQTAYCLNVIGNNELFRLLSTLRDISGQVAGVMFTQPVYQKVTHTLASDIGITLYELQLPIEQSVWEPMIGSVNIQVDTLWAKAEKERLGVGDQQIQLGGHPKELFIYDGNRQCIDSVQGLFNDYIKRQRCAGDFSKQCVVHTFDKDTFIQTQDERFPFVKLNSIGFELEFFDSTEVQEEEMLHTILRSVLQYFSR